MPIIVAGIPEVASLVTALLSLRKSYPLLSSDQIGALVATITGSADAAFNDALSKIAADELAHPHAVAVLALA
jgi:hypothetical protein